MSASYLPRIFRSDSKDTPSPRAPPSTPTQIHTSCSRSHSNSVSRVQPVSPEQKSTSASVVPTDEILPESQVPEYQAHSTSIKPTSSKSGKSKHKPEPSTTHLVPSRNILQPSTRYFIFSPALVLQNTGSVARDHLASERTFLSYVRTSLGLASAGVALVQLFTMSDLASKSTGIPLPAVNQRLQKFATPLGLSTLAMSLIVLIMGE